MGIGTRMRVLRKGLCLTQKDVADAVGARERYVSDWEREKVLPHARYLGPLARTLGTTTDFLLMGSDTELTEVP
jgi:transcriptional regulator with XRE-family HTH domain